jgi:hypothetical protein
MGNCTDVFGRELHVGDLVLTCFVFAGTNLLSVAEIVDISRDSALCSLKSSEIKKSSYYHTDFSDWWCKKVYKLYVDDYNNDFDYFFNNYKRLKRENPAIMYEFFGRNLQLGDFIFCYHCSQKGHQETYSYGIMLGPNRMFTTLGICIGGIKYEQCFKIEHPSADEEEIYKNLIESYHLYQVKKAAG